MKRLGFVSLALMTALSAGCNKTPKAADTSSGSVGTSGRSEVSVHDKEFVEYAAMANMAEVELARFAVDHSTDAEVKKFAQMMIDEHTKAGASLRAVASQHNITLPDQLDIKQQALRDDLAKKAGLEYDQDYMKAMVDNHADLIDKLEPRIDAENLRSWKVANADKLSSTVGIDEGALGAIKPETSDDPIRFAINNWAAASYPAAQSHLIEARALYSLLKKKTT